MQVHKLAALILGILVCTSAMADECAVLSKGPPEIADLTVDWLECRELTDKTRNGGKPLSLHQLEEARSKLSKKYRSDTLLGAVEIASLDQKVDCMIALGHFATCHCLSERLPVGVSFVGYLRVVTSAPGVGAPQFGISQTDFAKLSGILWSARDQCIVGRKTP